MKVLHFIKHKIKMLKEILLSVGAFITGGGLVTLLTVRSARKKSNAEATGAEINNASLVNDEWRELLEVSKKQWEETNKSLKADKVAMAAEIEALKTKLDERWAETLQNRDKYLKAMDERVELISKIGELQNDLTKAQVFNCNKRGCEMRTPPTGI